MEHLEERNEMSETPLIREAADGNSKNVLLLLEAGAEVDAQQINNIGFTALHQAGMQLFLDEGCSFFFGFSLRVSLY
jgi:ankyrin repeat protein